MVNSPNWKKVKPTINRAALMRRIERYTKAVVENEWKGNGDPDLIDDIEKEVEEAKAELDRYIRERT